MATLWNGYKHKKAVTAMRKREAAEKLAAAQAGPNLDEIGKKLGEKATAILGSEHWAEELAARTEKKHCKVVATA